MLPKKTVESHIKAFDVDSPKISIHANAHNIEHLLKRAGIAYTLITRGYLIFSGYVFGSDIPLMIGIHFTLTRVTYIEIFRPHEYFQSEHRTIEDSFAELSQILRRKYGAPLITTSASIHNHPCEQWMTPNYMVNHFIMDRFGPEEHLHINFYKK